MARPAFTQDISYDLEADGSTIVAFKGLRIPITKTSPAEIEYVVKPPFAGSLLDRMR